MSGTISQCLLVYRIGWRIGQSVGSSAPQMFCSLTLYCDSGWHQSITVYVGKIREMFAKMFAILPRIDSSNQGSVNKYLKDVYEDVTSFAEGVNPCYINGTLQEKFKDFEQSEERRLRANLETVRYDIDAMDTLALITGPGRIGKVRDL